MSDRESPEVEVLDPLDVPIPAIGRRQRRLAEAIARQIQVQRAVTEQFGGASRALHERLMAQARHAVAGLDRHDPWIARLGDEAARDHAVAKVQAYQTQMSLLMRCNREFLSLQRVLFDDLAARPDAFWFDESHRDRFAAWWEGTSLALEDRGMAPLTFRESLRQFALGDVVDRKARGHDDVQSAGRRALRAQLRAMEQLVASFATAPVGPPTGAVAGEEADAPLDAAEVEQLLRELLQTRPSP